MLLLKIISFIQFETLTPEKLLYTHMLRLKNTGKWLK